MPAPIPPIAFATGSYNASSSQNISLGSAFSKTSDGTAYTPAAGDFIAVWIVHSGTATRTLAQVTAAAAGGGGAAYSPINPSVITSSDTNVLSAAGSWRFVTTENVITLPGCAANTNSISWIALLFQNIDTTTPLAGVTPTTATAINGGAVDCPSITTPASPSGCTMVGFGGQAQSTGAALTAPTTTPFDATARYTGFVNNTAQTNDSAAGYGIKTGLGASTAFNPSAFAGGTTANTDAMGALSFILKPTPLTTSVAISGAVAISTSQKAAASHPASVGGVVAAFACVIAAATHPRAIGGAVVASGKMLAAAIHARCVAGLVGLSRSFTAAGRYSRGFAAAVAIEGTQQQVTAHPRGVAGAVAVEGIQQQAAAHPRAVSGGVATSSSIATQTAFVRTIAGAIALTGTATTIVSYLRTVGGQVSVLASTATQTAYRRTVTGAVALSANVARSLLAVRSVAVTVVTFGICAPSATYGALVAAAVSLAGTVAAQFRHAFITPDTRVLKLALNALVLQVTGAVTRFIGLSADNARSVSVTADPSYTEISTSGDRTLNVGEE